MLQAGRQRGRRRDRVNACLGADGADGERPRRRPLRHRLGPEDREARRPQRLGPRAARRSRAEKVPPEPDGTIPLYSPVRLERARLRATAGSSCTRRYGKLPLADVLAPAIRYAEEGFPLSPVIASRLGSAAPRASRTSRASPRCSCPAAARRARASVFRNPALAKTLRLLADEGRDAYYEGPIADGDRRATRRRTAASSRRRTSPATARRGTSPIRRTTAATTSGSCRRTGRGIAALQMLNLLEGFDLAGDGPRQSADFWHVMVEAKKLAFADRARYYADPAFAKVPVAELLSKEYAKRAREADRPGARRPRRTAPGDPEAPAAARETTYLCTADDERHDGLPHPEQLHRLRLGLRRPGARLRHPEPRRPVLAEAEATRTASSRASAPSRPSSRPS